MSKKLLLLPALILGAFLILIPSCGETDDCEDVDCGANGVCISGTCDCDEGYELGLDGKCDVEWSNKFLKDYTGESSCNPGATYIGTISRVDASNIKINEFGGFSGPNFINATLDSEDTMVINYTDAANRKFTGTGTLAGSVLTINVTIDYNDGSTPEVCTDALTLSL